jgi:glycosyltransferase involved in cell wall biosynthesis
MWATWAGWRAIRNGAPSGSIWSGLRRVWSEASPPEPPALHQTTGRDDPSRLLSANGRTPQKSLTVAERPTVSVLIPTLDRYPQLFDLLDQLRRQEEKPLEIVVVDQTEAERRERDWPARYADLPLQVIRRDVAGQCSSRNAGLSALRGETVLFLDDDDRIPNDLIRCHLDFLASYGVDASCGVAEEVGAGALPPAYRLVRDSDVFPTNNSLLRTEALRASGLFDLAYDRGERADGDLGMRLYLAGKLLALNPAAAVVHLHAPRGGLRQHKARIVTRSASRHSLWQRQLLAPTEGYLWLRYFSPRQVNEALLIRTVSSLRGARGGWRSLARILVMAVLLPDTWRQNQARLALGRELMWTHPTIPDLHPTPVEEVSCL